MRSRKEELLEFIDWAIDDNVSLEIGFKGIAINTKQVCHPGVLQDVKNNIADNYNDELKLHGEITGKITSWSIVEE